MGVVNFCGASSRSKNGGAYFSVVAGSIQDPIAVPGPCEVTECKKLVGRAPAKLHGPH